MEIIVVEDEHAASENLIAVIKDVLPESNIMGVFESVQQTIAWVNNHPKPGLAFFDIHLADGLSFEIFEQTKVDFPVVFTTAYNEYAIRAFKVNSIDYILKPVKTEDVRRAVEKFNTLSKTNIDYKEELRLAINDIKKEINIKSFKKAFLVHYKDKLIPIPVESLSYFYIDSGAVFGINTDGKKYLLDNKLEKLENQLNPEDFFRVNRQFIVARKAILEANYYFNGKLSLKLQPEPSEKVLVSKARAVIFKAWLDH